MLLSSAAPDGRRPGEEAGPCCVAVGAGGQVAGGRRATGVGAGAGGGRRESVRAARAFAGRGPSGARFACVISRASRSPARADIIAMVTTVGTKEAEAQNRSATCLRSPRKRLTRGPSSGQAPGGHCGAPPLGGGVRLRDFRPRQGEAPAAA